MNDEQVRAWRWECLAERLLEKMKKRGFNALYAPTEATAKEAVLSLVPATGVLALLGSQTMNRIGVFETLRQSGRELVDHATQTQGLSPAEAHQYRRRVFTAEAMLASANAVDYEGRLYNIDGMGNRVAPMIYGPDKVILAVGLNKVVRDPAEAWLRARQVAAPLNAKRLSRPTPCVKSGRCHDCQLETSICNYFTVIDRSNPVGRLNVVLIRQDVGY